MPTLTDQPALDFLSRLFPGGLGDAELLAEACPEGWENSPLWLAFHPGPERRYEEHCLFMKNMERLKLSDEPGAPVPTFEEFLANEKAASPSPGGPLEEWQELLGECLWDVISDKGPPDIVQAYQEVFGEDPPGWPPDPKSAG